MNNTENTKLLITNQHLKKLLSELETILLDENQYKKTEQKLDIPFLLSGLYQSFYLQENLYLDFINCLSSQSYYVYLTDSDRTYNKICKAIIQFYDTSLNDTDYRYEIDFFFVPRNWKYCSCNPTYKDYREDKKCCGHGCDWDAPAFEIRKSFVMHRHEWMGDQAMYWDFEDQY